MGVKAAAVTWGFICLRRVEVGDEESLTSASQSYVGQVAKRPVFYQGLSTPPELGHAKQPEVPGSKNGTTLRLPDLNIS